MLRVIPTLETVEHELRHRVCSHCYRRPRYSESFGPEAVRPCEQTCPIFVLLPKLRKTAMLLDPMLGSRREALQHRIDECGKEPPTANEDSETPTKNRPLARYRDEVVNTVLDLVGEE